MKANLSKIKKILWITSTLHTAGGGTRLLLEGAKYYRSLGIKVYIVTWDFDKEALFDNEYPKDDICILVDKKPIQNNKISARAFERFKSIFKLRAKIKEIHPDIIFNQGEYDCTFLYLVLLGLPYQYISLIFGQMFQFHKDIAKYTLMFKGNLNEIRSSTPGYQELVPLKCPSISLLDRLIAEVINFIRYYAVRKSTSIFVFSKQVQWEVSKLYKMPATISKGAYPRAILSQNFDYYNNQYTSQPGEKIILSLCRLIKKKRVDLKIKAFHHLLTFHKVQNVKLLIGGKGEDMESLVELAKSLGLEESVVFIGYVQEKDVFPLTSSCDVYTSLDVADFDISPYEALGLRRPVIWSSEMDRDDFLTNCPAVFSVTPDIKDVASAMKDALILDTSKIDWSGLNKYTWEYYFQHILGTIESRLITLK